MRRIIILDDAFDDASNIHDQYESIDPWLAERFYSHMFMSFAAIERNPRAFGRVWQTCRVSTIRKYPHLVYFRILRNRDVVVFAIRHGHEDPRTWKRRYRGS